MAMRIQEVHPSLVHLPIALFPTAIAADALGALTGSRTLMGFGKALMPLAAGSMALAGVAGLAAQEAVKAEGAARDILTTHRTLNMGLLGLATALSIARAGRTRPGPGYLLAGFAGIVAMSYSAYLGGHMVYAHGVGVDEAGGVERRRDPPFAPGRMLEAISAFFANAWLGLQNAVSEMGEGRFVPTLTGSGPSRRTVQHDPALLDDANRI
jgi:uncharacterized membrane protein